MANNETFDAEFIQFYLEKRKKISENSGNLFQLYNHGTFYSLHDNNAEYVSKNFLNTIESLKQLDIENEQMMYTLISQTRFPSLIRHLLIENNFAIEIYSKTNPKSNLKNWRLETEASPGCLGEFENLLYEADVNISIQLSAVYIFNDGNGIEDSQNLHVSIVSIDPIECGIFIGYFEDNDCLRQLETILVRSNPKECFIPDSSNSFKKLTQLLRRNHVMIRKYSIHYQNDTQLVNVLRNLAAPECKEIVEKFINHPNFCDEILYPLKPLLMKQKLLTNENELILDDSGLNYPRDCFFIQILKLEQFVRLDLSSIQHLHLFPTQNDSKLNQSLFQILNQCKTNCGGKLLEQFLRKPSTDSLIIKSRLDIVEFFIENPAILNAIREQVLPKMPDVSKLYKKLKTNRYQIKDIFNLYYILEYLRHLFKIYDNNNSEKFPNIIKEVLLGKLSKCLSQTNDLYMKLVQSLDLDSLVQSKDYKLNAKIFPELIEVDALIRQFTKYVQDEHSMLTDKYDCNISLEQSKDLGWYYEISKNTKIDNSIMHQLISSKSEKSTKFTTRLQTEINDEYISTLKQYEKLSQNCIRLVLQECKSELYRIPSLQSYISSLDVLSTFAKFIIDSPFPYVKPEVIDENNHEIVLKKFRHPILESINGRQFVPNDIKFDKNSKVYLITGPNMGGKSTLLRSIALSVLMAQIGCYVPCESARISLTDAIYTRMSSNDDQSLGVSTFMAEMQEMAGILKSAKSSSLILIDELGRSTSTNDGFGLAQSIIEYIAKEMHSYTLFATHFHNLGLSLPKGLIHRLHMQSNFDEHQKLIIHYRAQLNDEQSEHNSQSFGIEVMKSVGMPEYLINEAKNRLEKIYNSTIDSKILDELLESMDQSSNLSAEKIFELV